MRAASPTALSLPAYAPEQNCLLCHSLDPAPAPGMDKEGLEERWREGGRGGRRGTARYRVREGGGGGGPAIQRGGEGGRRGKYSTVGEEGTLEAWQVAQSEWRERGSFVRFREGESGRRSGSRELGGGSCKVTKRSRGGRGSFDNGKARVQFPHSPIHLPHGTSQGEAEVRYSLRCRTPGGVGIYVYRLLL